MISADIDAVLMIASTLTHPGRTAFQHVFKVCGRIH